jgi:biopolymer transport protein TolR
MAHLHQHGSRRPMAEINVVPFIDVMLVLLVIFMITTPLLTQGVKIDLPKTEAKALPPDQKEPLIVTVDSRGNYYLNISSKPNQPITPRVLSHLVSTQLAGADYGKIVEAMVVLQQAGAKSVGLITQPYKPDQPTG